MTDLAGCAVMAGGRFRASLVPRVCSRDVFLPVFPNLPPTKKKPSTDLGEFPAPYVFRLARVWPHTSQSKNCAARPKCPLSPPWPESARRGCVPPACAALFLPLLHAHVCGHDVRLCQLGSGGALDPWGAVPVSLLFPCVAWHFFCLSPVPHCQPWPPPVHSHRPGGCPDRQRVL